MRDRVRVDWENDRRNEAIEAFYDALLEKYEVRVDWPEAGGGESER